MSNPIKQKTMKNIFQELFDLFKKDKTESGEFKAEFVPREVSVRVESWDGENKEKFRTIAKEVFSLIGVDVSIYVPHNSTKDPVNNDKINIIIWSAKSGPNGKDVPERIWGIPVDCRDKAFPPTQAKENIIYDGDYAVAELVDGNNLYIFHDIVHKGTDSEMKIFRMILENSLKIISPDVFAEILRKKELEKEFQQELSQKKMSKYHDVMKKHYVDICLERFSNQVKEMEGEVESGKDEIQELQNDLIEKIRETQDLEKRLSHLKGEKKEIKKELEVEFEKLLEVPKVLNVLTNADGLVEVFTDTLYCKDPRTNNVHEIGKFKISISQSGGLRWENLTRRVDAYKDRQMAPHIWSDGKACLGNMDSVFPELLANYEYSILAQMAIQFVESVNVDDAAGKHINKWPIAK